MFFVATILLTQPLKTVKNLITQPQISIKKEILTPGQKLYKRM
jgi:hypothetical protein